MNQLTFLTPIKIKYTTNQEILKYDTCILTKLTMLMM